MSQKIKLTAMTSGVERRDETLPEKAKLERVEQRPLGNRARGEATRNKIFAAAERRKADQGSTGRNSAPGNSDASSPEKIAEPSAKKGRSASFFAPLLIPLGFVGEKAREQYQSFKKEMSAPGPTLLESMIEAVRGRGK